eukprot:4015852-Amphidinium_carterae.1
MPELSGRVDRGKAEASTSGRDGEASERECRGAKYRHEKRSQSSHRKLNETTNDTELLITNLVQHVLEKH